MLSHVEEQVKIRKELSRKKMGRPLILGEDLDRQVATSVLIGAGKGWRSDKAIAIASVRGIVRKRQ